MFYATEFLSLSESRIHGDTALSSKDHQKATELSKIVTFIIIYIFEMGICKESLHIHLHVCTSGYILIHSHAIKERQ